MSKPSDRNYLQPKFLYPLGARPLSTLNPSAFVLQALRDRPGLSDALPDANIFTQFRQHPFIVKSLPAGSLRNIQPPQWRGKGGSEFLLVNDNISYGRDYNANPYPALSDSRRNAIDSSNLQSPPQEQTQYPSEIPSPQGEQEQKPSRFQQHPGTQAPASIRRDIEAQNPQPAPPNTPTPPNPQQLPPNLQRYAQQLKQQ
ncbi:MAG: hypothetical protein AAGA60_04655, partial [Cyanobacteria bacterium P01_E01_bin.42]